MNSGPNKSLMMVIGSLLVGLEYPKPNASAPRSSTYLLCTLDPVKIASVLFGALGGEGA